jgi:hypothetical protein
MPHGPRPHPRLAQGELPPPTVAWLHPIELVRTAYHAYLSHLATSYIDRREVLAALDRTPVELESVSNGAATSPAAPPRGSGYGDRLASAEQNEDFWIDFLADIGDSWEATYAVASLVAQRELQVGGYDTKLPHADLVVLGGDLVYPSPTRDSYRRRTSGPLGSAFPNREEAPPNSHLPIRERRLVAIPGNHDWYDGLTSFVREFCQGGWLGGWRLVQPRSYFALKLTPRWWIWGIDIALDTRIDPAQQAYFIKIASQFDKGDNVILCTAKPSWLPSSRYSNDAYTNLEFVVRELVEKHGRGHVAMILSGDLHHYARYEDDQCHQLITSGSGGAYLMGTHHLPAEVQPFKRAQEEEEGSHDAPKPWRYSGFVRSSFTYPSQSDSRRMALGALLLPFRRANMTFCVTVGLIALWIARMLDRVAPGLQGEQEVSKRFAIDWSLDGLALISALVIVAGCAFLAAASNRRASRWLTLPWGTLHGVAQIAVAVLLALVLYPNPLNTIGGPVPEYIELPGYGQISKQLTIFADSVVFVLIAGWIGATLVGIYLTLSDLLFRWHHNEVFAAQSICDYRSFVRIHVESSNRFTIYPIGLRHVPRWWRSRLSRPLKSDPYYEPTDSELLPHLIEGPIRVNVSDSKWPSAVAVAPAPVALSQ